VPFTDDEHPVGHLGADGEDKSFRVGVGPRATRWNPARADAGIGQYSVEGGGELPSPVPDQESELVGPVA
jgi:hypothetical protein